MWRTTTLLTAAALGAAILASGCGDEGDTTTPATTTARRATLTVSTAPLPTPITSASDLDGRTFVSTAVVGHDLVPGSRVTLAFEDGRLSARAGCNTLTAPFSIVEQTLRTTGQAAGTMMGCEPKLQRQDDWLSGVLERGVAVSLIDDTLTLRGQDVGLELVDEGKPKGKRPPIVGTAWTMVGATDQDGKETKVPTAVKAPTIEFGKDGRATVFTGCNRGGGKAKVGEDGLVHFGPLALTRMACVGAGADLEAMVTQVLQGTAALAFSGEDDLIIARAGNHLVYKAG